MPLGLQLRFAAPPPLLLYLHAAHFVSYKLYFDRSTDVQSELLLLMPPPPTVFHKHLFAAHCIEPGTSVLLHLSALSSNFPRAP